VRNKQTNI